MNKISHFVKNVSDYEWDYIHGQEGRDDVLRWKTLVGNRETRTEGLTFGIFEVPPGVTLAPHYHKQHEIYYVQSGEGEVLLNEDIMTVKPGSVIFIPGDMTHALRNVGKETISLMWIFPTDKWADVKYHMLDQKF